MTRNRATAGGSEAGQPAEQTVLVTGASRGIGAAIASRLATAGHPLVLNYRSSEAAANTLAEEIRAQGGSVRLLPFDVSDRQAARDALTGDIDAHGAYYGVVCNAGITRDGLFAAMDGSAWDDVVDTNLGGLYNVLQPLILPMIRRRRPGRIVTLSSVSGLVGNQGQVNYSAAKAGIIGASKALAVELAGRGITVNCVAPGLIETDMSEDAPLEQMLPMIPMGRMGSAAEVAGLVAFLLSDEAAYITRQVIAVSGGLA